MRVRPEPGCTAVSRIALCSVGILATLKSLLREYPELVEARSTREHQATLLHYVAANGVEDYRQKTPKNAVKVATVLIEAGAEVDADLDYGLEGRKSYPERLGSTTLGLVATSFHTAKAGVQIALLETLLQAGARIDGIPGGWNPLVAALHNGRGDAAACLARNGANLDLEGAAGVGCLEPVKKHLRPDGSLKQIATFSQLNHGFLWACEYGRTEVVKFLAKRVPQLCARRIHGATGLHQAAYGGHSDVVSALLKRGAPDVSVGRSMHGPTRRRNLRVVATTKLWNYWSRLARPWTRPGSKTPHGRIQSQRKSAPTRVCRRH
jgi:ankyrin repeat protein